MSKPWLLIDIDGVLNPFWSNQKIEANSARTAYVEGFRMVFVPWHAEALIAMQDQFRLAWCSWWKESANLSYRHEANMPELPYVKLEGRPGGSKVNSLLNFVGEEPFVWLDDDVAWRDKDRLRLPNQKLIEVDPYVGLLHRHLHEAREWAEDVLRTAD